MVLCLALRATAATWTGEIVLNDDGGWSWFEDERAMVAGGKLIVGSVAMGRTQPERRGDIEVVSLDLHSGRVSRVPLHRNLEADDHDSPALLELPDGRLLAMYTRHGPDARIHWRISRYPGNAEDWGAERVYVPSDHSRITYSNLHWLSHDRPGGRLYDFFRGLDNTYKPSWVYSDDRGESWRRGGVLIDVPARVRHRPYVKYVSDGRSTVHVGFTEGHPRDFDNSLYHAWIRGGVVYRSDGQPIRRMADGPILPEEATRVYAGDSNHVAWIHDLALDRGGGVRMVWSVQRDSAGLPPRQGGQDHRYHWGAWDGTAWRQEEVAYAGSRLYAGEDDYTGGICLHPDDHDTVFISTNVDPVTGAPRPSGHYELFRGTRAAAGTDQGRGPWVWEALTPGASEDQLRPIAPRWRPGRTALVWLRGTYRAYTDYDLSVVARIEVE